MSELNEILLGQVMLLSCQSKENITAEASDSNFYLVGFIWTEFHFENIDLRMKEVVGL